MVADGVSVDDLFQAVVQQLMSSHAVHLLVGRELIFTRHHFKDLSFCVQLLYDFNG